VGLPSIRLRNSCTDVRCTTSICRVWLIDPEWAGRQSQAESGRQVIVMVHSNGQQAGSTS
jgi:hypothetical protein